MAKTDRRRDDSAIILTHCTPTHFNIPPAHNGEEASRMWRMRTMILPRIRINRPVEWSAACAISVRQTNNLEFSTLTVQIALTRYRAMKLLLDFHHPVSLSIKNPFPVSWCFRPVSKAARAEDGCGVEAIVTPSFGGKLVEIGNWDQATEV